MVDIRLRVQRVRKIKGRYYWWPTPAVQALGFASEALGYTSNALEVARRNFGTAIAAYDAASRPGDVMVLPVDPAKRVAKAAHELDADAQARIRTLRDNLAASHPISATSEVDAKDSAVDGASS